MNRVPASRHPIDWLIGGYLLITLLLLIVGTPTGNTTPLIAFRLVFFVAIGIAWRLPAPRHRVLRFLRVAYPALLLGLFYDELDVLNTCVTDARFDALVVGWEQTVFRSMPSVDLRSWLPWWPVAELVHVGYVAYYLMVPALLIALALKRDLSAISESVFTIAATFIGCYAFFILMPVVGPFHYLEAPNPHDVGIALPILTHKILHAGSSVGTAFPSSHVAAALAVTLAAIKFTPRFGAVLLVLTVLLAVGAVYGGYHYAIDAAAGALLALVVVPAARAAWRGIGGYREQVTV
jgi:membrane-associated phospholipid phosphatase